MWLFGKKKKKADPSPKPFFNHIDSKQEDLGVDDWNQDNSDWNENDWYGEEGDGNWNDDQNYENYENTQQPANELPSEAVPAKKQSVRQQEENPQKSATFDTNYSFVPSSSSTAKPQNLSTRNQKNVQNFAKELFGNSNEVKFGNEKFGRFRHLNSSDDSATNDSDSTIDLIKGASRFNFQKNASKSGKLQAQESSQKNLDTLNSLAAMMENAADLEKSRKFKKMLREKEKKFDSKLREQQRAYELQIQRQRYELSLAKEKMELDEDGNVVEADEGKYFSKYRELAEKYNELMSKEKEEQKELLTLRQSDREHFGRMLMQQKHFENLLSLDQQNLAEERRNDQVREHVKEYLNEQGRNYVEYL